MEADKLQMRLQSIRSERRRPEVTNAYKCQVAARSITGSCSQTAVRLAERLHLINGSVGGLTRRTYHTPRTGSAGQASKGDRLQEQDTLFSLQKNTILLDFIGLCGVRALRTISRVDKQTVELMTKPILELEITRICINILLSKSTGGTNISQRWSDDSRQTAATGQGHRVLSVARSWPFSRLSYSAICRAAL